MSCYLFLAVTEKSNWTLLFSLRLKYAQGTLQIRKSASCLLNSMIDLYSVVVPTLVHILII